MDARRWIPETLVPTLIEHGHLPEVRRLALDGDWNCARGWARALIDTDEQVAALAVLTPFVEAGHWDATDLAAGVLDALGRREEAIALVRPRAEAGDRLALARLAKLLAADEAFDLLRPHTDDWYLADALVTLSDGLGRDEELAGLLRARLEVSSKSCGCRPEPSNVVRLLATVLERQGHIDDAVTLLRTSRTSVNDDEQLADLLAGNDRLDELRAHVAGEGGEWAADRLARLLESRGDVDAAVEVLRPFAAAPNPAVQLAELLTRNGRAEEAIEVLRPIPYSMGGDIDWVVHILWTLLADQGRPEQALALIDDLMAREDGMDFDLFCQRTWLLSHCGHLDQAIKETRAHPESTTWYGAAHLADLLTDAGRMDEAIAVLEPTWAAGRNHHDLAKVLILRGRVKDAIAVLHERGLAPSANDPWSDDPPF